MSDLRQCDHCKNVGDPRSPGWIVLAMQKPVAAYMEMLSPYAGRADLCSWSCVAGYAVLQQLDPSPQEPA